MQFLDLQGVPKKMVILSDFEFLTLGGVFLRVKNNSKNSGTKKNIRLFSKILSRMTLTKAIIPGLRCVNEGHEFLKKT